MKKSTGMATPHLAADTAIYTHVDVSVPGVGLVYRGRVDRIRVLANARRHWENELAKIHAALEALDGNRVRIVYKRAGVVINGSDVLTQTKAADDERAKVGPRV